MLGEVMLLGPVMFVSLMPPSFTALPLFASFMNVRFRNAVELASMPLLVVF